MGSTNHNNDLFIDTPQALSALCQRLGSSEWIAFDTEFIRERTYYPRLCLLQLATPTIVASVDPLAFESLNSLLAVIYNPRITKVLHAAYQDLEIFHQLRGEPPGPVFDTQIAASVLGFGEQVGYANLVQQVLGVQLAKAHTRSDWCLRPLDAAQLQYAADDVRYLSMLYPRLLSLLTDKDRLTWLADDFERLSQPHNYQTEPQTIWERIGGTHTLAPRQLCTLRALAMWREREAADRDLPRKWVLSDSMLMDLARLAPRDRTALTRMRGLQKNQVDRYGAALIARIGEALEEPESSWPQPPPRRILSSAQESVVDLLMALVRHQAARHEVSPASIATRGALERLVLGDTDIPLMRGWRAKIAGDTLQKMLAGKLRMSLQDGCPHLEETRLPEA